MIPALLYQGTTTIGTVTQSNKLILRRLIFHQANVNFLLGSEAATDAEEVTLYMCAIQPGDEEFVGRMFADYFTRNQNVKTLELTAPLEVTHNDSNRVLIWSAIYATTLRTFRLHNLYNGGHLQGFCEQLIASNPFLEELKVPLGGYPPSIEKISFTLMAPCLRELDFSGMDIGDETFARLASAACATPNLPQSLEVLILSRNRIHRLPELTRLVKEMGQLRFLDLCGNGGLFQVDLLAGNTDESRSHCASFMKTIASHKNLSTLLIRACSIQDREAGLLFGALTENTSIQQIDLDFNLIEIQGVAHLIKALPNIKGLRTLEMDDLELTEEIAMDDGVNMDVRNDQFEEPTSSVLDWGTAQEEALLCAVQKNLVSMRWSWIAAYFRVPRSLKSHES